METLKLSFPVFGMNLLRSFVEEERNLNLTQKPIKCLHLENLRNIPIIFLQIRVLKIEIYTVFCIKQYTSFFNDCFIVSVGVPQIQSFTIKSIVITKINHSVYIFVFNCSVRNYSQYKIMNFTAFLYFINDNSDVYKLQAQHAM